MSNLTFDFSHPNLFNDVYLPIIFGEHRLAIVYGGRGSAKSTEIAKKIIIDTLTRQYSKYILMRKAHVSIRDSQFSTIVDWMQIMDLTQYFEINTSSLRLKCKLNNNLIISKGLDKSDKAKSVSEPTGIWYEEANQISYDDHTKSSDSLRTTRPGTVIQEIMTFNPETEHHWIESTYFPPKQTYEREDGNFHWVKSTDPDAVILHTTYKDNKFLDPIFVKRLEQKRIKNPDAFRVDSLGLWGNITEGLAIPYFEIIEPDQFPRSNDSIFGIDYGYEDPSCIIEVVRRERTLYINEIIYVRKKTNSDLRYMAKELIPNWKNLLFYSEHDKNRIEEFYRDGFKIFQADKGPDSILNGIDFLRNYDIKVTSTSHNVIREMRTYRRIKDKNGILIDKYVDADNHAMDAIRYAAYTHGRKYWIHSPSAMPSPRAERKSRFGLKNQLKK